MSRKEEKHDRKMDAEHLGRVMKTFGNTVSEILEDPKLREKAMEFSQSIVDAAAKFTASKVKDEEVRTRFREVGKAAQSLGQSLTEHFKTEG